MAASANRAQRAGRPFRRLGTEEHASGELLAWPLGTVNLLDETGLETSAIARATPHMDNFLYIHQRRKCRLFEVGRRYILLQPRQSGTGPVQQARADQKAFFMNRPGDRV